MALSKQPYKGTRDFYPQGKRLQKWMFARMRETVERFGYQEYDAPLLEPLELYIAKSGDELVNEQTYAFTDRGGREVVIRPEMTPSLARMVAVRRQEFAYPLRLYNIGSRWRYERPQRGRNREFFQLDVDLFGVEGIEADAEIIQVADAVLKGFGAKPEMYEIRVNSRDFLNRQMDSLNLTAEQKQICVKLLDRQAKIDPEDFQKMFYEKLGESKATELLKFLKSEKMPPQVLQLLRVLKSSGVANAAYDPSVVRGLEYYTDIVFEVFDKNPQNNRAMFGGGRYDGLVGLFGVEPIPTVGFAMGDVTLQNFLESNKLLPRLEPETQAAAILIGDVYEKAQKVLQDLRSDGVNVAVDSTDRKLDAKIKAADKAGMKYVLFIGEEELKTGRLKLKNLETGEEKNGTVSALASVINA